MEQSNSPPIGGYPSRIDPFQSVARSAVWSKILWALAAAISLFALSGTLYLTYQFSQNLPPRITAGIAALGWSPAEYYWIFAGIFVPLFLVYFLTGTGIYWLRPHDRMALFTSIFLMTFGASLGTISVKEYLELVVSAPLWIFLPSFICGMLSFGLLAVFFATFPDGRFVPGWMRWIALEGILLSLAWLLFPNIIGKVAGFPAIIVLVATGLLFGASLYAQLWRFRNYATGIQRQQTKWFVFGCALLFVLGVVPWMWLFSVTPSDPRTGVLIDLAASVINLVFGIIPLSIGIAILRFRLWDIDVILRRTLQYSLLSGILGGVFLGIVVLLQNVFGQLTGESSSPFITVISTLVIAALFNPMRKSSQQWIDRRFFRAKYNAEQALAAFAVAARDVVDLADLTEALVGTVEVTMKPECVSLWLKSDRRQPKG